jgi:hypothetical protein
MHSEGNSWVDFTRAISAITLFGSGFGELFKPSGATIPCSEYPRAPIGRDCLIVPTSVLRNIISEYGYDATTTAIEIVEDVHWYVPNRLFTPCPCTMQSTNARHDDPVQVLVPSTWLGMMKKLCGKGKEQANPGKLEDGGAVIFGKSSKFPLRWGGTGDPEWD